MSSCSRANFGARPSRPSRVWCRQAVVASCWASLIETRCRSPRRPRARPSSDSRHDRNGLHSIVSVIVTGCLLNPEPARNFHGSLRSLPSSARRAGGCAEMSNASPSKTAVTERASGWSDFGTRSTKSPRCARLCRRPRRGGGCDGSPPHPTLWILYASYFASLPIPVVLGCMITSATCLSFGSSRTTSLFWSLANSKSFAAGSDLSRCSEAFPASVIAGPSRRPWLESRLPPVDSFQTGRSGKSTASV